MRVRGIGSGRLSFNKSSDLDINANGAEELSDDGRRGTGKGTRWGCPSKFIAGPPPEEVFGLDQDRKAMKKMLDSHPVAML